MVEFLFFLSDEESEAQKGEVISLGHSFFSLFSLETFVASILVDPYFHQEMGCLIIVVAKHGVLIKIWS